MRHMLTRALGSAAVILAALSAAGCSDDNKGSDAAASQADAFAEFFVASGDVFVFESVDRATPDPLEASEGETCFTAPTWVKDGAPYARGDARPDPPSDTQRGEVNLMRQCELSGDDEDPSTALCAEVERQGELRAEDVTDAEAIAALIAVLPEERRTDAALFYYPYGGDIPDGVDTSGTASSKAGDRLYALYRETCGYEGP